MTSNQLQYWKLEEEKRSNRAKETETARSNRAKESLTADELAEVRRHNLTQEELTRLDQDLTSRGLDIKSDQQLLDVWSMYAKYGSMSLDQMPEDVRIAFWNKFGYDGKNMITDPGATSIFADIWYELKDFWHSISSGVSKAASSALW